jgi:hypothetical protein
MGAVSSGMYEFRLPRRRRVNGEAVLAGKYTSKFVVI